jgi:hypothetical protein
MGFAKESCDSAPKVIKEGLLMSINIKNPNIGTPAPSTPTMEWAHRSLVLSSQQKLFEKVLSQVHPDGKNGTAQEISALEQELDSLQSSDGMSQRIDKSGTMRGGQSPDPATANPLATSTLLKLQAISPRGDHLSNYLGSMGSTILAGGKAPQSVNGSHEAPVREDIETGELGNLSAQFESGEAGVDVIGYDENGGTSYGTYQIASRTGTMRRFMSYLEEHSPQWASRLKAAGPDDTGSRRGAMPMEWKRIAAEDPERFEKLQHDFIEETHYRPALEEVYERTGLDVEKHSKTLQEVLWSTAVQHGPKGAANIFCKAINRDSYQVGDESGMSSIQGEDLIQSVYASRSGKFGSSSSRIRNSVQRRFEEEKRIALNMLNREGRGVSITA